MAKTEMVIGYGIDDAIADVAAAWKAAECGAPLEPSDRIYVRDWTTLYDTLTPERHALLKHLRQVPAQDGRDLAIALGRDVERVAADIAALEALGLLSQAEDGSLRSDVDEITSTIRIAA